LTEGWVHKYMKIHMSSINYYPAEMYVFIHHTWLW